MHIISHKPVALWSLSEAELHIPDGFLNLPISLACWAIAIAIIALAARRAQRDLDERQAPLLGIMAAFIFAAQMINFPITGGTSGHLLGGVLAAVTLGPWGGILVMTAVIAIQALLFQDGGLLVMGANILNMGMITALIGYGLYRSVINQSQPVRLAVIGVAAWLSVMGAALATSLQLWLSGTIPLDIVIPAMMSVHALIGIGEALITVAAVAFIMRTRPEVMETGTRPGAGRSWIIGGAIAALIVVLLSPLASADPDGLERVAGDMGFIDLGQSAPYEIIPDYTVPFLGETPLSTIVAGLIGVLVVAVVIVLVARALGSRRAEAGS